MIPPVHTAVDTRLISLTADSFKVSVFRIPQNMGKISGSPPLLSVLIYALYAFK